VPTPYPVEEAAWNFSHAVTERKGVVIGTREFDVPRETMRWRYRSPSDWASR